MVLPEVWRTEVCAGLDPTQVARVLHERDMLERSEKSYQKAQRIGPKDGDVARCYTVTSKVLYHETDVTDVTGVTAAETGGFSHSNPEGVTAEKSNKTGPVTPVTSVTPSTHTEDVADGTEVCAQCGAPDNLGSHPNGACTVWLHESVSRSGGIGFGRTPMRIWISPTSLIAGGSHDDRPRTHARPPWSVAWQFWLGTMPLP